MISIEDFIPHTLLQSDDYAVVANTIMTINNDIKEMISIFPELVDIDNAPEIFLPKLAALVRYEGRYDIPDEDLRDIISRIINVYRDRGTDYSIIMAATYGDQPEWVGSSLFYESYKSKELATIIYPITRLFRHSVSKFSGSHYYPDSTRWRDGTLIISAPYINQELRNAVSRVVPAGLRVYWEVKSESNLVDGTVVTFGEWVILTDYLIDYYLRISDKSYSTSELSSTSYFSGKTKNSGRQLLFDDYELEYYFNTSFINDLGKIINDISKPNQLSAEAKVEYFGKPNRSRNAKRSGKYAFSGLYIGEIFAYAQDEQITPDDRYYRISEVINKPINGYVKDYSMPIEVEVVKGNRRR